MPKRWVSRKKEGNPRETQRWKRDKVSPRISASLAHEPRVTGRAGIENTAGERKMQPSIYQLNFLYMHDD